MTNGNEPAYPAGYDTGYARTGENADPKWPGVTKLEAFTMANVAALLSKYGCNRMDEKGVAMWALSQAKATIAALNSEEGK